MKINKLLFTLILCVFCLSACSKETEVSGEIFVVTEGAGNYKLGLVQVAVIPEADMRKYLESSNENVVQRTAAAQARYDNIAHQLDVQHDNFNKLKTSADMRESIAESDEYLEFLTDATHKLQLELAGKGFFQNMPQGVVAAAATNADGKFALKIPKTGKYAIAARATRKVGSRTEEYYWLNWLEVNGEPKMMMLSNNNMTNLNPPEAVLKTNDIK